MRCERTLKDALYESGTLVGGGHRDWAGQASRPSDSRITHSR